MLSMVVRSTRDVFLLTNLKRRRATHSSNRGVLTNESLIFRFDPLCFREAMTGESKKIRIQ